jgi:hypothetical protein
MRRVILAATVACLIVSIPWLNRWTTLDSVAVAPVVPGFYVVLALTDAADIDYFDESGDFDEMGLAVMIGVSLIFWFVTSLLIADIVNATRKLRREQSAKARTTPGQFTKR